MNDHITTADCVPQATVASLEKIPVAAKRMGLSVASFYRVAKRDGIRIVKVSDRASAVPSEDVTAWIQRRVAAARGVTR